MSALQFFIRHQSKYLQDKFILIFKSDEAREYFEGRLQGSVFEELTSEQAQHAARIGINGKTVPYGYTARLTKEEMNQLSITEWEKSAEIIAEGNERLYKEAVKGE